MWELVELKVPAGWEIVINNFYYLPLSELETYTKEEYEKAWLWGFLQDLLYVRRSKEKKNQIGIDLGWYPEGEENGAYGLVVIKDDDWERPLQKYKSRNIDDIIEKINFLLEEYNIP